MASEASQVSSGAQLLSQGAAEQAAASEVLSAQARFLKELAGQFRLKPEKS